VKPCLTYSGAPPRPPEGWSAIFETEKLELLGQPIIHKHPNLKIKSIPLSIGLCAAVLSQNIFEQQFHDYLKKVDAWTTQLKLGARSVSIGPI
jgi:hypothetical protein